MSDTTQLERDSRIRTTALVVLTFIAVAVALYFLRPVLLPFVLALFIASGLVPLLNLVQARLGSSRAMAIFLTALLSVTVTVALWSLIAVSVGELLSTSGPYRAGFNQMLGRVAVVLQAMSPDDNPAETPRRSAAPVPPSVAAAEQPQADLAASDALEDDPADVEDEFDVLQLPDREPQQPLTTELPERSQTLSLLQRMFDHRMERIIRLVANELFAVFSSGLLVMIFLFFLLLGGSNVQLPENNIWRDVDAYVRQYIVTKTLISAITGLVFGMVLWFFGVPLALVLGLLAFLLNFIPNLGPIIASLLPVPLVWVLVEATWAQQAAPETTSDAAAGDAELEFGLVKAALVIALAAGVQFVSGNVVEPKIMGEQFRLHPIAILLSLMFWYMIWGLVGAFLAVPITSALKIILGELESTRTVADLLEGNLTILAKRSQGATGA